MRRSYGRGIGRLRQKGVIRRYGAGDVKNKSYLRNNLKNLTLCIFVVLTLLLIKNMNFSYARRLTNGVKTVLTKEYNIKERIVSLKGAVPAIQNRISELRGSGVSHGAMIMPVQGDITSGYGMRAHPVFKVESKHEGIDIAADVGEPVKAALPGVVVEAGSHPQFGMVIVIEHSDTLKTLYGHLEGIDVLQGQEVSQGQRIGAVGKTGLSTGSHLHFEVWKNDTPVDPMPELNISEDGGEKAPLSIHF